MRVKAVAAERGMGPSELSKKSNLSERQVYKVLHGETRLRLSTVGKLANALGTSVDYLIHGTGSVSMVMEPRQTYQTKNQQLTADELITEIARQLQVDRDELGALIAKLLMKKFGREEH